MAQANRTIPLYLPIRAGIGKIKTVEYVNASCHAYERGVLHMNESRHVQIKRFIRGGIKKIN